MGGEQKEDASLDAEQKSEWRESVRSVTGAGAARMPQRAWKPGQARRGVATRPRASEPLTSLPASIAAGDISVIFVSPKTPTNVGVIARACAQLARHGWGALAAPERFSRDASSQAAASR